MSLLSVVSGDEHAASYSEKIYTGCQRIIETNFMGRCSDETVNTLSCHRSQRNMERLTKELADMHLIHEQQKD
ncbi:hypothetical protein TNCV_389781 [Trichonephila clavipes]|nr:hypothetical protein TNCV_389781 [Trichonephila clavipes]